jgi:arylformamidase
MSESIQIRGVSYAIDIDEPIDISIPLNFNGPQPNAYGVTPAESKACEFGDLVGDTRRGGSCNFEQVTLIPHCNGTHTECVGHITHERISVRDCLKDVFIPAMLISVDPEKAADTTEAYAVEINENDLLITRNILQNVQRAFRPVDDGLESPSYPDALIIRALPNDESKLTRQYVNAIPPFFSTEAMQHIVDQGFKHLLVDLPSIDRLHDKGKLSNHRIFWNIEPGGFEIGEQTRMNSTITELIYVPNEVKDGEYLLNLQIAPFAADASPSRPILFKLN